MTRLVAMLMMSGFCCVAGAQPLLENYSVPDGVNLYGNPLELVRARLAVELRRVQGARTEKLRGLLLDALHLNAPDLDRIALALCRSGEVDCEEIARIIGNEGERGSLGGRGARALDLLRRDATLQRMAGSERTAIFAKALEIGAVEVQGSNLSGSEAAIMCLQADVCGLRDAIVRAAARWPPTSRAALFPYEEVATAMGSSERVASLVTLVRRGAEEDIRVLESSVAGRGEGSRRSSETSERTARLALGRLRRESSLASVEGLRRVLDLYVAFWRSAGQRDHALPFGNPTQGVAMQLPSWYLGVLGREITEAVGDLGDRELERKLLGGSSLVDRVREAETKLVQRGVLGRGEMVSE